MRQLTTVILTVMTFSLFGQDKDSIYTVHTLSEPMPSYPGGMIEMAKFIKKNLKYPKHKGTAQGKVFIGFTVNEDGSLSEFKVVKGLADAFDESALETVKKMPNWIPARKDNKTIGTKMVIPITFED